jgi:hypothetical protein
MMATMHDPYVVSGRPDLSPTGDRVGWNEPVPRSPPEPTFWPAVMALAITVAMWGILLDFIVLWAAAALFAIAAAGWIGDLLRNTDTTSRQNSGADGVEKGLVDEST